MILGDGGPDHVRTVQYLVEAGADLSIPDRDGVTALQHAEVRHYRAIAEINRAKDQALDELFSTLAKQVSQATEQVVGRALTGADQERLIQDALQQFARQKA